MTDNAGRPPPPPRWGLSSGFATIRDLVTFIAGLVIIGNEVFFSVTVEAAALGVGVALAGLPLALQVDERRPKR